MDSFACECKDCALANASDCESVIRRLISGKKFFTKKFDIKMKVAYNTSEGQKCSEKR